MNLTPRSVVTKGKVRIVIAGTDGNGAPIPEREIARDDIAAAAKDLAALAGNTALEPDYAKQLTRVLDDAELVQRVQKAVRKAIKDKKPAAVFDLAEDLAKLSSTEYAKIRSDLKTSFGAKLSLQDLNRAVKDHREQARKNLITNRTARNPFGLTRICTTERQLRELTDDSLLALTDENIPPQTFVRIGQLVRLTSDEEGRTGITPITEAALRGRLERSADYFGVTADGEEYIELPPLHVVKDILSLNVNDELDRLQYRKLPALKAVVESPIVRPDGSILLKPGYDVRTRLYYAPGPGLDTLQVPDKPTDDERREAVDMINEVVCDFPFADEASRTNWWAHLLSHFMRPAITGKVPLVMYDKPTPGTGGSLLAEATGTIATGREVAMEGAPSDDEEWRKKITSMLEKGLTTVIIDNVEHVLESDSLARLITCTEWSDRVLGQTKHVSLPNAAVWCVTGNNVTLGRNLVRRVYQVRLDAKMTDPHTRTNFKNPDLIPWILINRPGIVASALTVIRAWYTAGKPAAATPVMASFEGWSRTIGGILEYAGLRGFLGNWKQMIHDSGTENVPWEAFLTALRGIFGVSSFSVAAIEKELATNDELRIVLPPELSGSVKKLPATGVFGTDKVMVDPRFNFKTGNVFKQHIGTRYGPEGLHLEKDGEDSHTKIGLWKVAAGSAGSQNACPRTSNPQTNSSNGNGLHKSAGSAGSFPFSTHEKSKQHEFSVSQERTREAPPPCPQVPQTEAPRFSDDDDYDRLEREGIEGEKLADGEF